MRQRHHLGIELDTHDPKGKPGAFEASRHFPRGRGGVR
jgi:hypothetical protein